MRSETTKTLISTAIIIAGLAAIFGLSGFIERARPPLPPGFEDEDLSLQGAKLKGYSLGFEGLIADWYWMRSLQYLGNKLLQAPEGNINLDDLKPLNPRLLYPYLNTATDLDPRFIAVYSYGAVVLPAIDPQNAIDLTAKGIANNPSEWRLYHYLGYIYWRLGQYDNAADIYSKGSRITGAPPFMQMMAAQMKTQGGSRDTARAMYNEMFAGASDDQTKESAALHLLRLDALDEIDGINAVLAALQKQNGTCPNAWGEAANRLVGVRLPSGKALVIDRNGNPLDPTGIAYLIENKDGTCKAGIDPELSKIPRQ
jgi:tetratricopeptide (TPR) repeat protein